MTPTILFVDDEPDLQAPILQKLSLLTRLHLKRLLKGARGVRMQLE